MRNHAKTISASVAAFCFLVLVITLAVGSADSAIEVKTVSSSMRMFSQQAGPVAPQWQVVKSDGQSLEVTFRLPGLAIQSVLAHERQWQTLEIPGSALHGSTGEPGLPVLSHLVAVPAGMALEVEILSSQQATMENLELLPIQDPASDSFAYSKSVYGKSPAEVAKQPRVKVGQPAILAGQTVVPLTFEPVVYDAAGQKALIWTEARLILRFISDPSGSSKAGRISRVVPESFRTQLENLALGYKEQASSDSKTLGNTDGGLGTYVAVHSGSSEVMTGIAPLLDWRRQQGYNVLEINTQLSGGSNSAIKAALQTIYDNTSIPPLEFIAIFGDVDGSYAVSSWHENLSGYSGGGDHYYTMLDGDDILADVHIGRISFRNSTEMNTVIGKIVGYEKNPPMDDTSWYGRACLQGDPSDSGVTTITTNQWLKGQLQAQGWAQIDTTWSGNFVTPMMAQVGQGVSAYGYRGFYGTSGIGNGHVQALSNGGKLAMALLPTCGSGNFASESTGRSEAWLRAPNGGAVAAVGTSTSGTHTRYNNCYYVGAWDGLLNGGDYRIGAGHTIGKVALYSGYFLAEPDRAEIWAVWNNIMGDPATEMWTGVPKSLTVDYPSEISLGAQSISVSVKNEGLPVAGARVSLYRNAGNIQVSGVTDDHGLVILNLPSLDSGSMIVTVTGHNLLPHLGGLNIGVVDVFCGATGRTLAGAFNPGASVSITPRLKNHGTADAFSVSAELTVQSGPATLVSGSLLFGNIASGSEVLASSAASIQLNSDAHDGDTINLLLTATNGTDVWTSILEESVQAGAFTISGSNLTDFGGSIDPGESGRFDLTLQNLGSLDASAVSATLSTSSPWITITDSSADFGDVVSNGTGRDPDSPFRMSVSSDCYGGHLAAFELAITYSSAMVAVVPYAVTIGTASADQPTGPDTYGYYAFDNTDENSYQAPTYDWVGIDPDHGAQGTDLGLSDFGWEQDDTRSIDLPFAFGYYGDSYNRISICSNGWLAMGETPVHFYRNFPLPASHSAGAMIAPFWDNLNQSGNNRVYTWYDESNHRFIIQWYKMPNHFSGGVQNFEVILLDPVYHPTSTGDGMILFQYDQVNNTDSRDGYATVGIQNSDRTDGINYSYWNQYGSGAAPLEAGRAILFMPMGEIALPAVSVSPAALVQTLAPGHEATQYLHVANNGAEGSILNFSLAKVDPATVSRASENDGDGSETFNSRSVAGSTLSTTLTGYDPGQTTTLPFSVGCSSSDDEYLVKVTLDFPAGVTVNSAQGFGTPQGDWPWNGQTGNGASTTWGDPGMGYYVLMNGQSGTSSVNVSFDSSLFGDVTIGWTLNGDGFGSNPHQVSGEITLAANGPSILVSQPVAGQVAILGDDLQVTFAAINGPTAVDIALQREAGGAFEILAAHVNADSSPWTWTVSGEPGPYGVIRVSDSSDASVSDLSGIFKVSRNLDWLQPATMTGHVDSGQNMDLSISFDATDLESGHHNANLVLSSNGGAEVVIPVALTVASATPVSDLPDVVVLIGNYPNPFNPMTAISFSIPTAQKVNLRVYSARGHLVRTLLSGVQPAGVHYSIWDGRDDRGRASASGVYFYRLESAGGNLSGKMLLAK